LNNENAKYIDHVKRLHVQDIPVMPYIKELVIESNNLCLPYIIDKFPNLASLDFQNIVQDNITSSKLTKLVCDDYRGDKLPSNIEHFTINNDSTYEPLCLFHITDLSPYKNLTY
jgi:hypothetical protein